MSALFTPATEHAFAWALVVGCLLWLAGWTIAQGCHWLMARVDRNIAGMVDTALNSIDLDDLIDGDTWALDYYLDANRAGYERLLNAVDHFDVDDALALANDHTFDNTLGEIRALPERQESA